MRPSTAAAIKEGPSQRFGGDRSRFDHGIIKRLVTDGLTDHQILNLALDPQSPFSQKARQLCEELGEAASLSYLLRSIAKHRMQPQGLRISSRADADELLANIESALQTEPASSFGNLNRRKVMLDAVRQARIQHTITPTLSVRSFPVTKDTASRHLRSLEPQGWIQKVEEASFGRAASYLVATPRVMTLLSTARGCVPRGVITSVGTDHPAFLVGFLNESGRCVLLALSDGADRRRKEIIREAGLSASTVDAALRRLVDEGLVERPAHGLYRLSATDLALEFYAESSGADLVQKGRRTRVENDRRLYGQFLLHKLGIGPGQRMALDSMEAVDLRTGGIVPIVDLS